MKSLDTSIEFVNHASVLVSYNNIGILCDPWYAGDAFHKGWNLLHETADDQVLDLLERVSHIWISHEHPDHFSVKFFKTYKDLIRSKNIEILFQKTKDKRVVRFLTAQGFRVVEIPFDKPFALSKSTNVTCIKDGFYDSALLICNGAEKILNLNDCEVTTVARANEVKKIVGVVDVLLTQFSFAAWKGGKNNTKWREEAAREKLATMTLQINTYKPKHVIPFASFVYFSNEFNKYLNDSVNTLDTVDKFFSTRDFHLHLMKPGDILGGTGENLDNENAKKFWDFCFVDASKRGVNYFDTIENEELNEAFEEYSERVLRENNKWLMKIIRIAGPIKAFQMVEVFLIDKNQSVKFDYLNRQITFGDKENPMLYMHSESLYFLFKNSFGFDTLTVNGCFEEEPGGFVSATKTLAIENLNNLGIYINLRTFFNISTIKLFLVRLYRVARKLEQ